MNVVNKKDLRPASLSLYYIIFAAYTLKIFVHDFLKFFSDNFSVQQAHMNQYGRSIISSLCRGNTEPLYCIQATIPAYRQLSPLLLKILSLLAKKHFKIHLICSTLQKRKVVRWVFYRSKISTLQIHLNSLCLTYTRLLDRKSKT